ncbi:hypothetical protein GCM10010909_16160 [Acidocella aquatica]|uniref:Uncharacterized protein n=1 Tax=Acidocella aquatica TaxID=1922313 RepID=A0ABQ6A3B7_9PROT|nr:hypothetical protein GCM10010909_16160 [Acidocella aquatica]
MVRCFSTINPIAGRPWASNLRSALRMDDANPTVSGAIQALLSLPTTWTGQHQAKATRADQNGKRWFSGLSPAIWSAKIRIFRLSCAIGGATVVFGTRIPQSHHRRLIAANRRG